MQEYEIIATGALAVVLLLLGAILWYIRNEK